MNKYESAIKPSTEISFNILQLRDDESEAIEKKCKEF